MIREYSPEDLDPILNIWLEQNLLAHPFIDSTFFQNNVHLLRTILPLSQIYVQDVNGVQGFIGLTDNYIAAIFVNTPYQRQGLGSSLIEKAKQMHSELFLNVYTNNKLAIHFFEQHGFVEIKTNTNQETQQPEYLMGCKIDHTVKIGKCAL